MKKFFAIAVLAVAALSANAQQEEGTWSIAPKAGINIANLTHDGSDVSAKVGFVGGVDVTYQVSEPFAISAGVFYSMQGCKATYGAIGVVSSNTDKQNWNNNYINVPILANYYVCKGLAIKAGVQPGFLLSSKFDGNNLKDGMKKFDFTIPMGVSYEYSNVIIDARYNLGLTKTIDADVEKSKNSVFQITLGYKIGL